MTGTGRYDRSMVPRRALLMPALTAMTAFLVVSGAESQILRDPRRLESGVDLVMVTATVLDAEGHLVTGLSRDAFGIWEDGARADRSRSSPTSACPSAWASCSM